MLIETTSNGIEYSWELAGSQGAAFILYPASEHSHDDIQKAKNELRDSRDVVSIRIASEQDLDARYKSAYFSDPRTRPLRWYQIEQDEKLIRNSRKEGISPTDFVTRFVLPRVEEVMRKNLAEFGEKIINF